MLTVTGWRMVGSSYKNGIQFKGYTLLLISDGSTRFYPDEVAIGPALDRVQADHGIDTTDAKRKLAEWVQTGIGVNFELKESR